MNEGYRQLELDDESRHRTTLYGTDCKMRYTRLKYGTISTRDIFDKAMDDTNAGLKDVLHIRDDFIVLAKTTWTTTRPLRISFADPENAASPSTLKKASFAKFRSNYSVLSSLLS